MTTYVSSGFLCTDVIEWITYATLLLKIHVTQFTRDYTVFENHKKVSFNIAGEAAFCVEKSSLKMPLMVHFWKTWIGEKYPNQKLQI